MLKNKLYTALNFLSMGISLACVLIGYLNFLYNVKFDQHLGDTSQIYRVYSTYKSVGDHRISSMVPTDILDRLEIMDDVESPVAYTVSNYRIKKNNFVFSDNVYFASGEFPTLFHFKILYGDLIDFKKNKGILISKSTAERYFKNAEYALNNTLDLIAVGGEVVPITISGVFENLPQNSTIYCEVLGGFELMKSIQRLDTTKVHDGKSAIFVRIKDEAKKQSFNENLQNLTQLYSGRDEYQSLSNFWIVPFKDVSRNTLDASERLTRRLLPEFASLGPFLIAIAILLIAVFNYLNCSISIAGNRLKEVGIRKVLGTVRLRMILQFMSENLLFCMITLVPCILFAEWLLPYFNGLYYRFDYSLSLSDPYIICFLVIVPVFNALLSGAYVATFVSKFAPADLLKGAVKLIRNNVVTFALLSFQMTLAVIAIVLSYSFMQGAQYQEMMDYGYSKSEKIYVRTTQDEYEKFANAIREFPEIKSICGVDQRFGFKKEVVKFEIDGVLHDVISFSAGDGFVSTMGMRLEEGQDFSYMTPENSIIVNKKFLEVFNIKSITDQPITIEGNDYVIVGVISNFLQDGLLRSVKPVVIQRTMFFDFCLIDIEDSAGLSSVLNKLQAVWANLFNNDPISFSLQSEALNRERALINTLIQISTFLAFIAIIISSSGLFSLTTLQIGNSAKEVVIRRILGATRMSIIAILLRKFVASSIISIALGFVIGINFSQATLQRVFYYHPKVDFEVYFLPVVAMFIIIWIIPFVNIYRASNVDVGKSILAE